jgi:hypothetical protein
MVFWRFTEDKCEIGIGHALAHRHWVGSLLFWVWWGTVVLFGVGGSLYL